MTIYHLRYLAWEDMPADPRATIWGTDDWVREFYTHLGVWNGTVHEMGHILRWHYGTDSSDSDPWAEETAVNDLAVAYWRARGETVRLAYFEALVRRALSTFTTIPVPADADPVAWFQQHYHDPMPFLTYGYYQEQMVVAALEKQLDLVTALRNYITPSATVAEPTRPDPYPSLDADLPFRIVDDMRSFLAAYGVEVPVVCVTRETSFGFQPVSREGA